MEASAEKKIKYRKKGVKARWKVLLGERTLNPVEETPFSKGKEKKGKNPPMVKSYKTLRESSKKRGIPNPVSRAKSADRALTKGPGRGRLL